MDPEPDKLKISSTLDDLRNAVLNREAAGQLLKSISITLKLDWNQLKYEFGPPPPEGSEAEVELLTGATLPEAQAEIIELQKKFPGRIPVYGQVALEQTGAVATEASLKWVVVLRKSVVGSRPIADKMVNLAMAEAEWFKGKKENDDQGSERVRSYWRLGAGVENLSGKDQGEPWSAAFISYLVVQAGGKAYFKPSRAHWTYVNKAIQATGKEAKFGFWGYALDKRKPQVGDLVCAWRTDKDSGFKGPVSYADAASGKEYPGHCDVVVKVNAKTVEVIGGNVNDDVSGKTLDLDANGFIDSAKYKTAFAILENRLDAAAQAAGGAPAPALAAGVKVEDALPASGIIAITGGQLQNLAPSAKSAYVQAFADANTVLAAYGINKTKLRLRHFMAQVLHESDGLKVTEESMNYSAERMMVVWKERFPTLESAQPYAHNQEKLGNFVYARAELGNGPPESGDGFKYRGRGLMQVTGKGDYAKYGKLVGADLVGNPELAFSAAYSLKIAAEEWKSKGCNQWADADSITKITQLINGGQTGIASRRDWYQKASAVWE